MKPLIAASPEFSRTSASLRPTYGSLRDTIDGAINAVKSNPQFRDIPIAVKESGNVEGWFDHRKLERALLNLLLNACESVDPHVGKISASISEMPDGVEITISDNGRGVPNSIRGTLFEPFVSQGKENGTGLGLTVVQKIIQDHGGDVMVEKTSEEGKVFRWLHPLPATRRAVPRTGCPCRLWCGQNPNNRSRISPPGTSGARQPASG